MFNETDSDVICLFCGKMPWGKQHSSHAKRAVCFSTTVSIRAVWSSVRRSIIYTIKIYNIVQQTFIRLLSITKTKTIKQFVTLLTDIKQYIKNIWALLSADNNIFSTDQWITSVFLTEIFWLEMINTVSCISTWKHQTLQKEYETELVQTDSSEAVSWRRGPGSL